MAKYCGNCSKSMGALQEYWDYGDFSYLLDELTPNDHFPIKKGVK